MRLPEPSEDIVAPKMAFMSDDCIDILRFAADSFDCGQGSALVTLVEIRGGAARSLGAQMAVRGDALYCGYVSGGCTEAAIAAEAAAAIGTGFDRYLRLGEGSRFFDIVLPCGGGITVAIHVIRESESLRSTLSRLDSRRRVGLAYDPASQSLAVASFADRSGWQGDRFLTAYRPKPRIVLSGASIEVQMTTRLATASGYDVGCAATTLERMADVDPIDEDTAVVILHHDLDREIPILKAALAAKPFYIGALGSRTTHERRSNALKRLGYDDSDIARIKAPIGLFPKARDSASLALSVLADIAQARSVQG